jgi:hypothetical protein
MPGRILTLPRKIALRMERQSPTRRVVEIWIRAGSETGAPAQSEDAPPGPLQKISGKSGNRWNYGPFVATLKRKYSIFSIEIKWLWMNQPQLSSINHFSHHARLAQRRTESETYGRFDTIFLF